MHQTFTGSSRRPRQVDLSGRRANPFANPLQAGPQLALQNAQHDRQQRKKQREELAAARKVQKWWRIHKSRNSARQTWREQWDRSFAGSDAEAYGSEHEAFESATMLLSFAYYKDDQDVQRLLRCGSRLAKTLDLQTRRTTGPWPVLYLQLEKICLRALERLVKFDEPPTEMLDSLADLLSFLIQNTDQRSAILSDDIFRTFALVFSKSAPLRQKLLPLTGSLLQHPLPALYEGFAANVLTHPQTPDVLQCLAIAVNRELLISAVDAVSARSLETRNSIWLLGQLIALLSTSPSKILDKPSGLHSAGAVSVIGKLLAVTAESFDAEATPIEVDNCEYDEEFLSNKPSRLPLNPFLKTSLSALIDQATIRRVLDGYQTSSSDTSTELATYVLTLLRVFPSHADDIRMWLYLGSPDRYAGQQDSSPIAFFWREARKSSVVQLIMKNARAAISLIVNKPSRSAWQAPGRPNQTTIIANEWKVVLIFLELYTFVLKLMDDEEFLGQTIQNTRSSTLR